MKEPHDDQLASRGAARGSATSASASARGDAARPRLAVFRSLNHIYAQVIDDSSGQDARRRVDRREGASRLQADEDRRGQAVVGRLVAERAKAAGVERVVFDRAGFRYHGRIKSLAEAAREAGLDF